MILDFRFYILNLLMEVKQIFRLNKLHFIIQCLLFLLLGCGGIRLPQIYFTSAFETRFGTLAPPLEKIFENTTVSGFPKDAGVLVDSFLFVGTFNGEVKVYNIYSGKSHGYIDVGTSIASAPIIDSERIFVALSKDKNSFVCYNITERKLEWKKEIGEIETKPLLLGNNLFLINTVGELSSFRKISGELRWKFVAPTKKRGDSFHSAPETDGDNIFFGSDDGILYSVRSGDGTLRWKLQLEGSIFSSPSISENNIFITTVKGNVFSIQKDSGTVQWKFDAKSPIYTSVSVNEKFVFIPTLEGNIFCLKKENGTVEWKHQLNGGINITPHVRGNVLYVGTLTKSLFALEVSSGKPLWKFPLDGSLKTNLISYKNILVAFVEDRSILAFRSSDAVKKESLNKESGE